MTVRARATSGEEGRAAARAVLALTLGVGLVAAAAAALIADPLMVVGIPTAGLALALWTARTMLAGYLAAGVWLVFVPRMEGEALLVPLSMLIASVSIAIGAERLGAWLGAGHHTAAGADEGWIEEA